MSDRLLSGAHGVEIPVSFRWDFADSTARASTTDPLTAVGYSVADLGKFAKQDSDNSIWMLIATTPTWVKVGAASLPFRLGIATTDDALADSLLTASAITKKPLVLQAASGQTANLLEAQSSTGTVGIAIDNNGALTYKGAPAIDDFGLHLKGNNVTDVKLNPTTIPPNTPDALADNMIYATAATQKGLVIQLQPGQTANGLEVQDSTGAILFSVDPSGNVTTGGITSASLTAFEVQLTGGTFTGDGNNITNLTASNIASGGTYSAGDGSGLTNLTAGNIAAGTIGSGVDGHAIMNIPVISPSLQTLDGGGTFSLSGFGIVTAAIAMWAGTPGAGILYFDSGSVSIISTALGADIGKQIIVCYTLVTP